jgi:hypothetical protein
MTEEIAIAVTSVRVAGFRSTTFLFIHLNAVTLEPPFVALPISQPQNEKQSVKRSFTV